MLEDLIRVARQAMERLLDNRDGLKVYIKQNLAGRKEPVTSKDLEVEDLLCTQLRAVDANATFLTEESAPREDFRHSQKCFIIDPIDGTSEYLRGGPHYAISIALAEQGRIESGVLAFPSSGRIVGAVREHGVLEEDCRPSDAADRQLTIAISPKEKDSPVLLDLGKRLNARQIVIPSFTSKALAVFDGLCDAACFLSDKSAVNIWDYAAGALILQEKGLSFTGLSGEILLDELPVVHRTGWVMGSRELARQIRDDIGQIRSSQSG